jgi:hypothetical protein
LWLESPDNCVRSPFGKLPGNGANIGPDINEDITFTENLIVKTQLTGTKLAILLQIS